MTTKRWLESAALCSSRHLRDYPTPFDVAADAVPVWERDNTDDHCIDAESREDRTIRERAGSLALIGRAIHESVTWLEDEVEVEVALDAWSIGHALDCAEDRSALDLLPPPAE